METPEELLATVSEARKLKLKYRVLAGGSNVVFPDRKFAGLVIHFLAKRGLKCVAAKTTLEVPASLTLASLITSGIESHLAGLEALSGIPGTVGGALAGNAGAYGQCISDHLISVQIWDGKKVRWIKTSACQFVYRDSVFKHKNWLILRARFKLRRGNKKELLKKSREIIKVRTKRYPPNLKCPGSFFKNVLAENVSKKSLAKINKNKIIDGKIPAGWLLAESGALNCRAGGIYVSDWHGNLIINDGSGTFRDVQKLAATLKNLVFKKFGIKLEEEVRYL